MASWAPDWTHLKTTTSIYIEGSVVRVFMESFDDFSFKYHHAWVDYPRTLIVLGYVVDCVVRFTKRLSGLAIPPKKQVKFTSRLNNGAGPYRCGPSYDREHQRRLYNEIYTAWRDLVEDDTILAPPPPEYIDSVLKQDVLQDPFDKPDKDPHYAYRIDDLQVVNLLLWYFVPAFDKALIDDRALARLASGQLALVPRDVQEGDLVFCLPGPGDCATSRHAAGYRPSFLTRPFKMTENDVPPPPREKVASAIEHVCEKLYIWREEHISTSPSANLFLYTRMLRKFNQDFMGNRVDLLHCTLVGECVMDMVRTHSNHSLIGMNSSHVDKNKIRVMAVS